MSVYRTSSCLTSDCYCRGSHGWANGIRVGSLRDGIVRYRIAGRVQAYPDDSNPEGVAVDAAGNVYGAVVSGGGAFIKSMPQR